MLLYSSGGMHIAIHHYFQSENFGCQKKIADFSGVFEKVVGFSGSLKKLLDMSIPVSEVKELAIDHIAITPNSRKTRKFPNSL